MGLEATRGADIEASSSASPSLEAPAQARPGPSDSPGGVESSSFYCLSYLRRVPGGAIGGGGFSTCGVGASEAAAVPKEDERRLITSLGSPS
ncbi:unnamed protein product [Eruca vesicaria subsp. sativa]|uniref:Uncharacterized protein n=1 Tax=Eruca vesicaria subsp. sativa TaxID=29727 RepID=A0ABC8JGT2_ERUVS|nr:unnamed protein product [Eruca vesicaria subsp. sativa]